MPSCPLVTCPRNCTEDDVQLEFPASIEVGVECTQENVNVETVFHDSASHFGEIRRYASVDVARPATSAALMASLCLTVMSLGALNNVLGKIRAKPLGACSYFSGIVNGIVYCCVYGSILTYRVWKGHIPHDQLQFVYALRPSHYHSRIPQSHPSTTLTDPLLNPSESRRGLWRELRSIVGRLGSWKFFLLAGICDAVANALAIIAQPFVPGPLFALMNQATLPMAAILSVVLLKKRYSMSQTIAICCVLTGGVTSLLPDLIGATHSGNDSAEWVTVKYSLLTVLGTLPTALSSALKEKVFRLYAMRQAIKLYRSELSERTPRFRTDRKPSQLELILQAEHEMALGDAATQESSRSTSLSLEISDQKPLDTFVIAGCNSGFQLLFTPLVLPVVQILGQFRGTSILSFMTSGWACFRGYQTPTADLCHACPYPSHLEQTTRNCEEYGCCRWALYSYFPYILVNMSFNILFLVLIVRGSAVVAFMTLKAVLPLAIILFAFVHWPLLEPEDTQVSSLVLVGFFIVCASIIWYRQATAKAARAGHS